MKNPFPYTRYPNTEEERQTNYQHDRWSADQKKADERSKEAQDRADQREKDRQNFQIRQDIK